MDKFDCKVDIEGQLVLAALLGRKRGDKLTLQLKPSGDKWYSPTYECDTVITSLGDGTASFDAEMWRNVSDRSWRARFIRWIKRL